MTAGPAVLSPMEWLSTHARPRTFDVFVAGKVTHNHEQGSGIEELSAGPFELYLGPQSTKVVVQWGARVVDGRATFAQALLDVTGENEPSYQVEGHISSYLLGVLHDAIEASGSSVVGVGLLPLVAIFGSPTHTRVYPPQAVHAWKNLRALMLHQIIGPKPSLLLGGYYHGDLTYTHSAYGTYSQCQTIQIAVPSEAGLGLCANHSSDAKPSAKIPIAAYKAVQVEIPGGGFATAWGSSDWNPKAPLTLEDLFRMVLEEDPSALLLYSMSIIGDWYG